MDQETLDMLEEKSKVYGDPIVFHRNLGVVWSGLLSHYLGQTVKPIPAHVVANMMLVFKSMRVVHDSKYHKDSYKDIKGYATIAEGAHSLEPTT